MHEQRVTIPLSDGGRIHLGEYGAPYGEPVFFFHGWPASEYQASLLDTSARECGLRILSPDRPGIGRSSSQPGRSLLDWPPLLTQIADALEVREFSVLGVSGGGPYALVSAWALPERIHAASIVCGAPPLAGLKSDAALMPGYRVLLRIYRISPHLIRLLFRMLRPFALQQPPRWLADQVIRGFPKVDAALLRDPVVGARCLTNFQNAWRGSQDGVFQDARIYAEPWGFPPAEIRVPIRLWHGRDDRNFSWRLAESLAREMPGCEPRFVEGEGHYSLPIRRSLEILTDLRDSARARALPSAEPLR